MRFVRKSVQETPPYTPGEQPEGTEFVKLNTNENPYPPSPRVLEAVHDAAGASLRLYPNPTARELREKIGDVYGFDPAQVFVGNGMDEVLSLIVRTFVEVGEQAVIFYPSYTLDEILLRQHGAVPVIVELGKDFSVPLEAADADAKVLFLPNPNSPTGILEPQAKVRDLCERFRGLVVIDEAYVDFAEENCLELAAEMENVLVSRTFSKSSSLAGLRVGFAVGPEQLIAALNKTKDSYNVNRVSQAAALAALEDLPYAIENVARIKATRTRLVTQLERQGFDVLRSSANFVMARHPHLAASAIYKALKEQGILVRYFEMPRLDQYVRITIGTDEETDRLLGALAEIAAGGTGNPG